MEQQYQQIENCYESNKESVVGFAQCFRDAMQMENNESNNIQSELVFYTMKGGEMTQNGASEDDICDTLQDKIDELSQRVDKLN